VQHVHDGDDARVDDASIGGDAGARTIPDGGHELSREGLELRLVDTAVSDLEVTVGEDDHIERVRGLGQHEGGRRDDGHHDGGGQNGEEHTTGDRGRTGPGAGLRPWRGARRLARPFGPGAETRTTHVGHPGIARVS
jgi:hypothetical protein